MAHDINIMAGVRVPKHVELPESEPSVHMRLSPKQVYMSEWSLYVSIMCWYVDPLPHEGEQQVNVYLSG